MIVKECGHCRHQPQVEEDEKHRAQYKRWVTSVCLLTARFYTLYNVMGLPLCCIFFASSVWFAGIFRPLQLDL